jgi:hypothetical protein
LRGASPERTTEAATRSPVTVTESNHAAAATSARQRATSPSSHASAARHEVNEARPTPG